MNLLRLFRRPQDGRQKAAGKLISSVFGLPYKQIDLYVVALRHKSAAKNLYSNRAESNERLEFLGDAVLDAVVADYLFGKYPHAEEGELTKMKSRIVSRSNLNYMAREIGIPELLETDAQAAQAKESISGNALEALFGAMYCDLGFAPTKKAILKVLDKHADLNTLEYEEADFKSRLFEYAHKKKVPLVFDTHPFSGPAGERRFKSDVLFDQESIGNGEGGSKKKAEQAAAKQALENLNLK